MANKIQILADKATASITIITDLGGMNAETIFRMRRSDFNEMIDTLASVSMNNDFIAREWRQKENG